MGYRFIQRRMRKEISILLIFVFMFSGCFVMEGYSANGDDLKPNDYIEFGGYRGTEILWRVVENSENGVLLWSENIITYKARNAWTYDANGERIFPSGEWQNSSLQTWLNSDKPTGKVFKGYENAPNSDRVTSNAYNNEAGFLANFTETEKGFLNTNSNNPQDRVFLLSKNKVDALKVDALKAELVEKEPTAVAIIYQETPKDEGYKNSYWLQDVADTFSTHAFIFHNEGTGFSMDSSAGLIGVVPAIYLNKSIRLTGTGTVRNPFKLFEVQERPTPNILPLNENASKQRYEMAIDETSMKFTLNEKILRQTKDRVLPLAVKTNKVTVELPTTVVEEDLQVDNQEVVEFNVNQESELKQKIMDILQAKVKGFRRASDLTEFKMTKKSFQDQAIKEFKEPLKVSLELEGADRVNKKTATYYIEPIFDEMGELVDVGIFYTGGQITGQTMEFYTDHFSFYIVMESNPTFNDVQGWAKPAVELLAARGIIHGYQDGEFKPKFNVNRIDFSVLLNIALEKKPLQYTASFADVKDSYYAGHILSLNQFGILDVQSPLTGNASNNAPNFGVYEEGSTQFRKITREETATFIANGYKYLSSIRPELPQIQPKPLTYADVSLISSQKMRESISIAEQLGVMIGYEEGSKRTFKPKNQLTRAEAAQVIVNFMTKFNRNFNE